MLTMVYRRRNIGGGEISEVNVLTMVYTTTLLLVVLGLDINMVIGKTTTYSGNLEVFIHKTLIYRWPDTSGHILSRQASHSSQ